MKSLQKYFVFLGLTIFTSFSAHAKDETLSGAYDTWSSSSTAEGLDKCVENVITAFLKLTPYGQFSADSVTFESDRYSFRATDGRDVYSGWAKVFTRSYTKAESKNNDNGYSCGLKF